MFWTKAKETGNCEIEGEDCSLNGGASVGLIEEVIGKEWAVQMYGGRRSYWGRDNHPAYLCPGCSGNRGTDVTRAQGARGRGLGVSQQGQQCRGQLGWAVLDYADLVAQA